MDVLFGVWQPIETAPRVPPDVVLVCYPRSDGGRQVWEAWWAIPYEAAPVEKGWWQTSNGVLLSHDVHGLGATHWMPLPTPPVEPKP